MTRWIGQLASLVACAMLVIMAGCEQPSTPKIPTATTPVKPQRAVVELETTANDPQPAGATNDAAATPTPTPTTEENPVAEKPAEPPPEVEGLQRFGEQYEVWVDKKGKRVFVGGTIARTEGPLEMFACLKNTKEHESVVAANTKAVNVNTALLLIGAKPGTPVQFRPEFKPASGPEVEVTVLWTDAQGKRQQARAQDWIRDFKTKKALSQPWVYGGSGFWLDQDTGKEHFMAEDGDFICISNFTSAMLDLPVESSQATADLQFEAFTERIPPTGTPVLLVLTPKLKEGEGNASKEEK